ncbi:hypothetical protein [Streptomyces durocortorensis]|uniref:Uncharacterized protein n=1 Tax=Streptomyces durocortorensis TaxID=2811104 RepID=A0ABS2I6I3_9ACTN|nr:hypothetical protein [Streptomyces durocortorensis]
MRQPGQEHSGDRCDDLGAAFEKESPVVRGRVGGAEARLFGLADAVAHAEVGPAGHRPRTATV